MDIRTAASRHRLYAVVDESGRRSNRNEGYLALVEAHASAALRHFISEPASLTPGERATIAFLVALQKMRTPIATEQVTAIANAALKTAASELFSDRHAFAGRYREFFDAKAAVVAPLSTSCSRAARPEELVSLHAS